MNVNDNMSVACLTLLPVMADILEDLNFRYTAKQKRTAVVNAIRSFDRFIMDNAGLDASEEQIKIQQAFRQWLNENFK